MYFFAIRVITISLVLVSLVGCGSKQSSIPTLPTNVPHLEQDAAREWIDAVTNLDGNRILKYTCLEQRKNVEDISIWVAAFAAVGQSITEQTVKGDISDLKFETSDLTNNRASVRVFGELRIAVSAVAKAHQLDENWIMVRENDIWRWCGSDSGNIPLTTEILQTHAEDGTESVPVVTGDTNTQSDLDNISDVKWDIVLTSFRDNHANIYSIHPDSTELNRITSDQYMPSKAFEIWPVMKSDSSQLVFTTLTSDDMKLFIVDAVKRMPKLLVQSANPQDFYSFPAWSPSGTEIVLVSGDKDSFLTNVIIVDVGSGVSRTISKTQGSYSNPSWSPNGKFIAYLSEKDNKIYLIISETADGEKKEVFIADGGISFSSIPLKLFTWSPDGNSIAIAANGVSLIQANTGAIEQLNVSFEGQISQVVFSPDGTQIALTIYSYFNAIEGPRIYIIDANGNQLRKLTSDSTLATNPTWSPDGQTIAFLSIISEEDRFIAGDYYLMDASDGANLRLLTQCFSREDYATLVGYSDSLPHFCGLTWK